MFGNPTWSIRWLLPVDQRFRDSDGLRGFVVSAASKEDSHVELLGVREEADVESGMGGYSHAGEHVHTRPGARRSA